MRYEVEIQYAEKDESGYEYMEEVSIVYWADSEPDLCAIYAWYQEIKDLYIISIDSWGQNVAGVPCGPGEGITVWASSKHAWIYEYIEARAPYAWEQQ